jgi:hypothetical protein
MTQAGKQEPSQHDSTVEAVETVRAWHRALNQGDVEQMAQLVTPDVVLGGPRSSGGPQPAGVDVLRAWVGRANIRLHPLDTYARSGFIVVRERAEWFEPDSGQIVNTQTVATVFAMADSLISRIVRHESLDAALAEAQLTRADLIQE